MASKNCRCCLMLLGADQPNLNRSSISTACHWYQNCSQDYSVPALTSTFKVRYLFSQRAPVSSEISFLKYDAVSWSLLPEDGLRLCDELRHRFGAVKTVPSSKTNTASRV